MSDDPVPASVEKPNESVGTRPEELPPVEPPSAGFIVQLFLIPALIVAAVIGVWVLFGRLADSDTNWEQLVTELGSSNEHRRWRAALGLAQVLRNQQIAPGENETLLADEPRVAEALTGLLRESLASGSTLEEEVKHQEFLARTLGALHADEIVLPVLAQSTSAEYHEDVRKSSLMALAMIAGHHFNTAAGGPDSKISPSHDTEPDEVESLDKPLEAPTITNADVLEQLRRAAQDELPGIRHLAAYVLALVSGPDAVDQLRVMLLDGDAMARANAAVGLARNGLTDGVDVLIELVRENSEEIARADFRAMEPEEQEAAIRQQQFERPVILSNCLRALDSLLPKMTDKQRDELRTILDQLIASDIAPNITQQAESLARRVQEVGSNN